MPKIAENVTQASKVSYEILRLNQAKFNYIIV